MNPLALGALADVVKTIVSRVWPDPEKQAQAQLELAKMAQAGELAELQAQTQLAQGQIDVNKVEAASDNLFVSGWRPFIGWVCGGACAWNWVFLKIVVAVLALPYFDVQLDLTPADVTEMLPILGGLLGLGTLRTIEKVKGTK